MFPSLNLSFELYFVYFIFSKWRWCKQYSKQNRYNINKKTKMICLIFIFRWESAWYIIDTFFYFYFILRNTCLSSLFCWYEKKLTFSSLAHRFAVCFCFFKNIWKKIYRTLCNTSTLKNKQIMISTSNQLHKFNVYTFVRSSRIIFF